MTIFDSKVFTWIAAILIAMVLSLGHLVDLPSDEHVECVTAAAVSDLADNEIHPTPQEVFDTYSRLSRRIK